MGNYVSCALSTPKGKKTKFIIVVLPSGEIKEFKEPTKAAELMLESPNFFLVNTRSLKMGRRLSALNADEDLELAKVYVMFPMKRINSMVTAADMGVLFLAPSSVAKQGFGHKVRDLPESSEVSLVKEGEDDTEKVPKLNLDDIEEYSSPLFRHRMSMSRSKKPLLDTIVEESLANCR
ncbi:DUF4228 domain-containing protein [Cephalotus follicularis]|uniref:DUF4228 domain-containing protein n=1 Tax=Cephalotus follicularis TaxID=3775 RepID=A0A1Q3BN78_CEPFO|nr:DUF4228 domain-containing protein [Cephalotus follicularis]